MGETPSTAGCASSFDARLLQQWVLFGSVRCDDLDSSETSPRNYLGNKFQEVDQGFGHGRAQMYKQQQKNRYQRNSYQRNYLLDNSTNYFTSLRGGASSQTSGIVWGRFI